MEGEILLSLIFFTKKNKAVVIVREKIFNYIIPPV
nr:MAG TPA: hypothetical protein [Caudoviricetes sp.]